jgi:MFS family permease
MRSYFVGIDMTSNASKNYMPLVIACCAILMVTMGIRQTSGFFVQPLVLNTGLSISTVSLAMAIGQFMWGSAQPVGGLLAERWGTRRVVAAGIVSVSLGMLLMPWVSNAFGVFAVFGVFAAVGAGLASFSLLMGAAAQAVPEDKRGFASGFINAGSSMGQFVFAPLTQWMIARWDWVTAGVGLGLIALASLPLVGWITSRVVHLTGSGNGQNERVQFSLYLWFSYCIFGHAFTR